MRKIKILCLLAILATSFNLQAEKLTIVACNDTHSAVQPGIDDLGGFLRRKALTDSIRHANKNTIAVHAGDAVQGSLFFSLYGGVVEYQLLDMMPYDYIISGNHEFDNGVDSLAYYYKQVKAKKLNANYDYFHTPLKGLFKPYDVMEVGGKRVGFFGVNVDPKGMIAEGNYNGVVYYDCEKVAHLTARYLKEVEHVDYVVMISHIGYDAFGVDDYCDTKIVSETSHIDLVVSAHSHTLVNANSAEGKFPSLIANKEGKLVPVVQCGRAGKHIAEITLDLENGDIHTNMITVDKRADSLPRDAKAEAFINKYAHKVDSLMNYQLATCDRDMANSAKDWTLANWLCDIVMDVAKQLYKGNIDFAIMNRGGMRHALQKGVVTKGQIISMLPFENKFVVIKMKGSEVLDALTVMASRGGDALSKQVYAEFNANGKITKALFNGKQIQPNKTYNVLTIDFLANGGDYMESMRGGERLFCDNVRYGNRVLDYLEQLGKKGVVLTSEGTPRMVLK